jgi:hypothetical protein
MGRVLALPKVEMLPVWLDENREPNLADEERSRQALDWVASFSEKFGTRISLENAGGGWSFVVG